MIPYSRQTVGKDDIREVVKVLESPFITQGPKVREFEEKTAAYCGAKYAVAFSSGTAALHAAYYAAGIDVGDEVITSPLTFAATANMALARGAKPVFSDIDRETGNLDPEIAEKKISRKTKAIVVVDYAGLPADLAAFKKIARKHDLVLIEDGAHSLGASYKGKKVGGLADMTMFSFHPVKSITTGEGGMIVTNDEGYYDRMMLFRSHGITKEKGKMKKRGEAAWYHEMHALGFNYRLTEIQAALGISQLRKLDGFIRERKKIAGRYDKELGSLKNFILPAKVPGRESSWHLYVVRLPEGKRHLRDSVFSELQKNGIGVQVHYIPVYRHLYYRSLGYKSGLCPESEIFSASAISIPLFPSLALKEQKKVIGLLKKLDKEI